MASNKPYNIRLNPEIMKYLSTMEGDNDAEKIKLLVYLGLPEHRKITEIIKSNKNPET